MHAPSHVSVLAGDDSLTLPIISVGGKGVIAVISNYAPKTFGALVRASLNGDLEAARAKQKELMPWYKANFLESNPIPVKYIVHKKLGVNSSCRLPLLELGSTSKASIDGAIGTLPD